MVIFLILSSALVVSPLQFSFSDRTVPLILNPGDTDGCLQGIGFIKGT
jgi:hypothetical protein